MLKPIITAMGTRVKISIITKIEPREPSVPGHLDPGLGNDICEFKVALPPYPSGDLMSHLLSEECDEWVLTHYDAATGFGTFISIDFDGPSAGTDVDLSSLTLPPAPCEMRYLREPGHEI